MEECGIVIVRGKQIIVADGAALRAQAEGAARVVVDLGAGDGRWVYRLARARPEWVAVAVEASAEGMREASRRAGRRPDRGGAPNAWFLRAAVEALPDALSGLADEIRVTLPWGSLLRAVLGPDERVLRSIARLGRPGAAVRIRVNPSALEVLQRGARLDALLAGQGEGRGRVEETLRRRYGAAGIALTRVGLARLDAVTSWGGRLGGRDGPEVLALDGTVQTGEAAGPEGG